MDNKYIDEEDTQLINSTKSYKKYSKKALFIGALGLSASALIYSLYGEPNFETLNRSISDMNNSQLIESMVFGSSFSLFFGGGLLYGLSIFMEKDLKTSIKKKKENDLEKKSRG
jgi:hypothetical protein